MLMPAAADTVREHPYLTFVRSPFVRSDLERLENLLPGYSPPPSRNEEGIRRTG